MHNFFSFILFIRFHMCFYFYYLLLILINKFSGHKRENVIFCMHLIKKILYKITHIRNIIQKQILFIYIKHKEIIDESK
jgi:hypothetical protein